MYCYHGIALKSNGGGALAGYYVECLVGNTVQPIYADNASSPIASLSGVANKAKTDARGNYFFYVVDGTYDLKYYDAGGVLQFSETGFTMVGFDTTAAIASSASTAAAQATASAASAATAAAFTGAKTANTATLISAIRNNGFFPQPSYRLAANDIATITVPVSGAPVASTIPGAFYAAPELSANKIDWVCGPAETDGSSSRFPRGAYWGGTRSRLYSAIEFTYTADKFEVILNCGLNPSSPNFRVLVNDKISATGFVPSDGGQRNILVQFPTSATRRIRIETANGYGHYGVYATSSGAISRTGKTYPLWSVIGDSFAEGTGTTYYDGEAVTAIRMMGGNINLAPFGGTGILNPGSNVVWTNAERLKDLALNAVTDQITGIAVPAPNAGVIMMTLNDSQLASSFFGSGANFQEAVARGLWTMIDHWQTNCAGKPLFIFGPTNPTEGAIPDIYRIRDAGAGACHGLANVWFIDRLNPGPALRKGTLSRITTTGNTTNASKIITGLASISNVAISSGISGAGIPTGARVMSVDSGTQVTIDLNCTATATGAAITFQNDQSSIYTTPLDGTHPNPAGHNLDGLWMADRIREIVLTQLA